jgi:hypothetical protein
VVKKNPAELVKPQMRLFFEDEAPRIGSGWRTVEVKVGRKWVRFTDTASNAKARLALKDAFPIILGSIERSSR